MLPTHRIPSLLLFFLCTTSAAPGDEAKPQEGAKKQEKPLPKLPQEKLPPRSRPKPDPTKQRYLLDPVFISIETRVKPEKGDAHPADPNIFETHLKEYFRRAGYPIAERAEQAAHQVQGRLDAEFHSTFKVEGKVAAWKYKGSSTLKVLDKAGVEVERFEIPEVFQDNVKSEESTVINLERYVAKLQWDKIMKTGKVFGNAIVVTLLSSLASDPAADDPETAEDVVAKLADIGFPAVPYLLDAMTDTRVVRLKSSYPGLKGRSLDDLRVYHVADKALEEVFQKVSRMGIEIGPEGDEAARLRRLILAGWEDEWSRFAPAFADSQIVRRRAQEQKAPEKKAPKASAAPAKGR